MDNDVVIPLWSIISVMVTAILALFVVVARALIHRSKDQPAPVLASCPGFDANNYVSKDVCDQIQNTTHVQIKLLDQKVDHTNEIVDRIEKAQDEKHRSVIKHVDDSFAAVKDLINNGK
jgi:hypothetical protein